jgi:hypothetical protein
MRRVVLRQARTGGKHAWGECAGWYPHHGQSSCRCANERRGEKAPRAAPRRDFPTPQSAFKPDWRSDPSSYWRPGGCPRMTSSLRGRDSQRRTRASHGGGGVRGGWGRTAAVVSDRSHVFACPRSRCAPAHSRAWCARASRGRRFRVLETTRGRGIIVMYSFRVACALWVSRCAGVDVPSYHERSYLLNLPRGPRV